MRNRVKLSQRALASLVAAADELTSVFDTLGLQRANQLFVPSQVTLIGLLTEDALQAFIFSCASHCRGNPP